MDTLRLFNQIDRVDKSVAHKLHKGISFAMITKGEIVYDNIPSTPEQRFVYLENTSKLTKEERYNLYVLKHETLVPPSLNEEDKIAVASAIDKLAIKRFFKK